MATHAHHQDHRSISHVECPSSFLDLPVWNLCFLDYEFGCSRAHTHTHTNKGKLSCRLGQNQAIPSTVNEPDYRFCFLFTPLSCVFFVLIFLFVPQVCVMVLKVWFW
ncbi:hypothetical protein COCVIDRAFT_100593 [Bipolaris victoriae FI3]|uniref:Uncharacterized protein n=1 Tax=Bipolaris victoriae (strain FI3) TaxID=930091 RepID=W7ERD8_BIPV3|nr:hypothetical protein COCVIDRAFT_100593 [Bipolaris victoriae FI3]